MSLTTRLLVSKPSPTGVQISGSLRVSAFDTDFEFLGSCPGLVEE
jgi:hypothetical protein